MPEVPSVAWAAAGLVLVLLSWTHYLWLIPKERVPARPIGQLAGMVAGSALAVLGLVAGGSDLATMIVAIAATSLALFFVYLLSRAKQPAADIRVAMGEPLPAFTATHPDGSPFASSDLDGRPTLFKVFRGHW